MKQLLERRESFLNELKKHNHILIIADNDSDGIIGAHVVGKYLPKHNPSVSIIVTFPEREEHERVVNEHPRHTPLFIDTYPEFPLKRAFVIDHHPLRFKTEAHYFNPHELGMEDASMYNAGFLTYLLFKDDIEKEGDLWKVAVSSYHDASFDKLRPFFKGIDEKKVKEADLMIGAGVPEHIDRILYLLEHSKTIDEFISDEFLKQLKEENERTFNYLIGNYRDFCRECNEKMIFLELPQQYSRFKSSLSTALSFRNPDKLVAVLVKGDPHDVSLRYQKANPSVGDFAKMLSKRWGTKGGGHAAAAGLKIPKDKLTEFVEELRNVFGGNG